MVSLFGFEIKRVNNTDNNPNAPSIVPKNEDDGALTIAPMNAGGGAYGTYMDLDGSIRTEAELISKYREMAAQAEIDNAVDDIVNEAIVQEPEVKPVTLNLDDTKFTPQLKQLIKIEFDNILSMLNFNSFGYDIFKRWYVDGRIYFHVVIDKKNPVLGIQELRYVDPRKIRKIRQVKKTKPDPKTNVSAIFDESEYFIFNPKGFNNASNSQSAAWQYNSQGIKIAKDSIIHVTSGLLDKNQKMILSYLHKAIKPLNQLRSLEDATVIYRISRAPERRIFYIDVGNLPKPKAEQYLADVMAKFKNKIVYDASTGEIRDDRKFMTMLEDFWLPRREGGRGTEISTLPAGQNLGEMSDVNYFLNKLYKSLNVPVSRVLNETSTFQIGISNQSTRDEIKFSKFITRLRTRFSRIFLEAIEKQLILKNLITVEDWDLNKNNVRIDFAQDNYFAELKESEIVKNRMETLQTLDPYIGRYYSVKWVQQNVLKMTEDEIDEMQAQIDLEAQVLIQKQAAQLQMQQKAGLVPQQDNQSQSQQ